MLNLWTNVSIDTLDAVFILASGMFAIFALDYAIAKFVNDPRQLVHSPLGGRFPSALVITWLAWLLGAVVSYRVLVLVIASREEPKHGASASPARPAPTEAGQLQPPGTPADRAPRTGSFGPTAAVVTHVRLAGGDGHEHISEVRWANPTTGASGQSSGARMVEWINSGGEAFVSSGARVLRVGVVNALPPYIRTYADQVWTDNLLALPRF
jgi:hypothetical protein